MSTIECDCGAATEGKWADKHHPTCAVIRAEKLANEIESKTAELERLNYTIEAAKQLLTLFGAELSAAARDELTDREERLKAMKRETKVLAISFAE